MVNQGVSSIFGGLVEKIKTYEGCARMNGRGVYDGEGRIGKKTPMSRKNISVNFSCLGEKVNYSRTPFIFLYLVLDLLPLARFNRLNHTLLISNSLV